MENERNHLLDLLELINNLQKNATNNTDINNTCTRPILGLTNELIYNTRPVSFYLCNNSELEVEYQNGEETATSNVFRVENIDNSCVTVRLLTTNADGALISTNEFATLNINCIAAIRCLNDISLAI